MSDNAKQPVHPHIMEGCEVHPGLTKRELFAAMAMQGFAGSCVPFIEGDPEMVNINGWARCAVKCADALLAALDKEQQKS